MTTIELIIAISIMITISSICVMKYKGDDYLVDVFARQLCSDIRYVRKENILNNKSVYIRFVKENDKWCYILHRNEKEDKKVFLPEDADLKYEMNNDNSRITFECSGVPKISGVISIIKNDEYRQISIVPVSGRVLYKEGIYEE